MIVSTFRKFAVLAALLVAAVPVLAQNQFLPSPSYELGVFYSPNYGQWQARVVIGNAAAGSGTIVLQAGSIVLPDGRQVVPFSTNVPITVDLGTNAETVTPSAVSGCNLNTIGVEAAATCTITATFSNVHGRGALVQSGDQGLQEAINDAGNNGGGLVFWQVDSGPVTLATGAATTTLCTNCIPNNAIVLGVVARVTTTIGTCTGGWELGDGTTATRFTAANTTLTAGTVSAADLQTTSGVASTTTGMLNTGGAKNLVNTCVTANASAGVLKARAFGYVLATSNF